MTPAEAPTPTPQEIKRPVLVFDGDCAFCTQCANWLTRRLAADVTVVPWQHTDLASLGTTRARAQYELLWADRDRTPGTNPVRGGARAIAAALCHCKSPILRLVGLALAIPPLTWLARPAYRLIARNRHRLPGGSPACALRPDPPAKRA